MSREENVIKLLAKLKLRMLITRFYDIFSGDKSHFAQSFPSPESIPAEGFPDPRPGCAPSSPRMCAIPGKDGAHPAPRPSRYFPAIFTATTTVAAKNRPFQKNVLSL